MSSAMRFSRPYEVTWTTRKISLRDSQIKAVLRSILAFEYRGGQGLPGSGRARANDSTLRNLRRRGGALGDKNKLKVPQARGLARLAWV